MGQRLSNDRLTEQLQVRTTDHFYSELAIYYAPPGFEIDLDEYGQPPANAEGLQFNCSFNDKPKEETWQMELDIDRIAGEIRFEGFMPKKGGEIQLQSRFDEIDENPQRFEIIGIQNRGNFGWVCLLQNNEI